MARYTEDTGGGGGGTFMRLLEGCLTLKSDTPQDGYEEYNTENPTTGAEVKYYVKWLRGGVEGKITRLERVEIAGANVYGWNLHMEDEDGPFSIFLRDDKGTTERVLKMFESIDLSQDVYIKVFKDEKGYPGIMMTQNKVNVAQFWNKENLPQPKMSKGKWDYSAIGEFLYNNAMKNIIPQFAEAQAIADAAKEKKDSAEPEFTGEEQAEASEAPKAKGKAASSKTIPF